MTDSSFLDCVLDDLEDLPEYKNFPVGAHRALASFEVDEKENHIIYLRLKGIESMELSFPDTDTPISEGQECSTRFDSSNKFGAGNFKKLAKIFGEALGTGSIRDIIEQTKDTEVVVITGLTQAKKVPEGQEPKVYLDIKELEVV